MSKNKIYGGFGKTSYVLTKSKRDVEIPNLVKNIEKRTEFTPDAESAEASAVPSLPEYNIQNGQRMKKEVFAPTDLRAQKYPRLDFQTPGSRKSGEENTIKQQFHSGEPTPIMDGTPSLLQKRQSYTNQNGTKSRKFISGDDFSTNEPLPLKKTKTVASYLDNL